MSEGPEFRDHRGILGAFRSNILLILENSLKAMSGDTWRKSCHPMTMDSGVRNPPLLGAEDFASPVAVSLSTRSMSLLSSALMEPLSIRDVLWTLVLSGLDSALPLLCDGGRRPSAACGDHTRAALLPQINAPTIHLQNHPSVGPTRLDLLCPRDEAYGTTVSGSNRTTSKPWSPPQRLSPIWLQFS